MVSLECLLDKLAPVPTKMNISNGVPINATEVLEDGQSVAVGVATVAKVWWGSSIERLP
jgi:hypothetical protein